MLKKIFVFLKTPKNIEIQNFEPKKMDRAYVCMKISEYPPWAFIQAIYLAFNIACWNINT